jgi:hypothetical protein
VTRDPWPLGTESELRPEAYPGENFERLVESFKSDGMTDDAARERARRVALKGGLDLTTTEGMRAYNRREANRARRRKRLGIGLGIGLLVYLVFLWGMSAGQGYVTKCVRSHTFDSGPDNSYTVCDYRVTNGRQIDIGSPFAWLGIPHIPGGPVEYGVGLLVILAVVAAVGWFLWGTASQLVYEFRQRRS